MGTMDALSDTSFLIFTSAHQRFALPYHDLIRIIDLANIFPVPNMPPEIRGCINVEGGVVILYDLRTMLSARSLKDEMSEIVQNLRQRKQDHLNWVAKLKDSIYNGKDITVESNPHKCAFGRWYDSYRPDSVTLANYMKLFDRPHKHIHQLATVAGQLRNSGREDEAKKLILSAEMGELNKLLHLFDGAEEHIKQFTYEYAVILRHNEGLIALTVDRIDAFERFDGIVTDIPKILTGNGGKYIAAIGRRSVDEKIEDALILDMECLLADKPVSAPADTFSELTVTV